MSGMFYNCSSLTELDLSNFNTSSVENMGHMFQGCTSLESLNLSGWTTKSIKYVGGYQIQYMFSGCTSLAELRLDKCDKDTVSMIINNANLPNNSIPGKQRTIWCDYSVLSEGDLTSPNGWRFEYAD
jgi:surface protein